MEFMLQWFWLVQLVVAGIFISCIYKWYKSDWKSKTWRNMSIVGAILLIISPVKLDTGTTIEQKRTNAFIKSTKELPPKVEDNSFKDSQQGLGITESELP